MAAKKATMWFNIGLKPDGGFYFSVRSEDGKVKAFVNASPSVLEELEKIKKPVIKEVKEGRKTIERIVSDTKTKVTIDPKVIITKKGKKVVELNTERDVISFLKGITVVRSSKVGATSAIKAAAKAIGKTR